MPKENQRVALSKRMLKEGVMKLLMKKNIRDISVSELCQVSGINRTTFYRHYQVPHDVLMEIEFDFVKRLHQIPFTGAPAMDIDQQASQMCHFLYENKDAVQLFIQNNTDRDLTLLFQHFADGFLASRSVLYKSRSVDADTLRLMTTFFAYGLYSLVRQWIIEDISKTPDEIAELIVGFFNRDISFY